MRVALLGGPCMYMGLVHDDSLARESAEWIDSQDAVHSKGRTSEDISACGSAGADGSIEDPLC